ncbi:MAG: LysE family transporter [Bacteroidota bacterium]
MSFLEGFGWGLAMFVFIGPVVFTLLRITLDKGSKAGTAVALGIIISDVVAILICMRARLILEKVGIQYWIALVGSLILLGLGLKYIFKPGNPEAKKKDLKHTDLLAAFSSGFLVNFVNPFVFMVWIGFIVYGEERFHTEQTLWIFLIGILVGIFTQDILKVIFSNKLKQFLKPERLKVVFKWIGVLLIVFAVRLFYFAISVE